ITVRPSTGMELRRTSRPISLRVSTRQDAPRPGIASIFRMGAAQRALTEVHEIGYTCEYVFSPLLYRAHGRPVSNLGAGFSPGEFCGKAVCARVRFRHAAHVYPNARWNQTRGNAIHARGRTTKQPLPGAPRISALPQG